jgi:hypothetical protein
MDFVIAETRVKASLGHQGEPIFYRGIVRLTQIAGEEIIFNPHAPDIFKHGFPTALTGMKCHKASL